MIAEILNDFPLAFVNTINSIGNGLVVDPETDTVVIAPKGTVVLVVKSLSQQPLLTCVPCVNVCALKLRLSALAVRRTSGRDVLTTSFAIADLVSVGTSLYFEGPAIFERLNNELIAIMAEKGYNHLDEFRGQLQTLA